MSYPRPLTDTEKALILRVLEMTGAPHLDKLRSQVEEAVATEPCPCPCPSIGLAVDNEKAQPIPHGGRLDAEVYYDTGAVMVWIDDGWLSNLETWWWSDDAPVEFPPLDSLRTTAPQPAGDCRFAWQPAKRNGWLPPLQLANLGFVETERKTGPMDSGLIAYRREPIVIAVVKDRGDWAFDLRLGEDHDLLGYGFGLSAATSDVFPPRPSRDPAHDYNVPGVIRWVIRRLLAAGFADVSHSARSDRIHLRLAPLEVQLGASRDGWTVDLYVDGWSDPVALPRFEHRPETQH